MAYTGQQQRIRTIRLKYGNDAFVRFGRKGGSPVIADWKKGKIHVNKRKPLRQMIRRRRK